MRSKPLCNLRKSQSLGFCLLHLQLVFVKMTLEIDISPYQHVHIYRTEWNMKHVSNLEVQFTTFKVSWNRLLASFLKIIKIYAFHPFAKSFHPFTTKNVFCNWMLCTPTVHKRTEHTGAKSIVILTSKFEPRIKIPINQERSKLQYQPEPNSRFHCSKVWSWLRETEGRISCIAILKSEYRKGRNCVEHTRQSGYETSTLHEQPNQSKTFLQDWD